jgi:calcium-dependent protein kinase
MILKDDLNLSSVRFPRTSPEAFDFLKKILAKDPDARLTLDAALEHPFIRMAEKFSDAETHEASADVVNSVGKFMKLSQIKKLMLKVVAFTLNPKQIEQLREDFYAIDTNRNGTISMEELRNALAAKGMAPHESFKVEDGEDGSIELNYSDFLAAAMLKRVNIDEDRLVMAFETLDSEGTGFVDVEALRSSLGAEQSDHILEDMIAELDSNNDGKIDYKEFLAYWKSIERAEKLTPLQRFAMSVKKVKAVNAFKFSDK